MNATFFCTQCGAPNSARSQFCSRCGVSLNPAPMTAPAVPAATPYPAAVPVGSSAYGGFWIRFVAAIVDAIVVQIVVVPVAMVFGGMSGLAGGLSSSSDLGIHLFGGGVGFIVAIAGSWLYEAFLESSTYQATLGKMLFGMKVTDLFGNRIAFGRATARHFAKYLSGMILLIGYIMAGFTERKQALHDMLAGTLVRRF